MHPNRDIARNPILVVEDNPINQRIVGMMLRHLGLSFEVVENGLHAVKSAMSMSYGLILMDIEMPELNGLDACKQIRQQDTIDPQPHVIALTASSVGEDICRSAGMDGIIFKPLRLNDLRSVLRKFSYLDDSANG